MAKWRVKELADLSGISVQTLHYYDQINLLTPSLRTANGYRIYSEKDLLLLQQIIALKYFGFELSKIKQLISANKTSVLQLKTQADILEKKAQSIAEASKTLKRILSEMNHNESIPWETIIDLIEVYRMSQELEKTWAGQILNEAEIKQYAQFEKKFNQNAQAKQGFLNQRAKLMQLIEEHLQSDPKTEPALTIASQWMDLINGIYGPENANLKKAIWDKGFKQGKIKDGRAIKPEIVEWLDIAINTYYRGKILSILSQVGKQAEQQVLDTWNQLMMQMCGSSIEMKRSLYEAALEHPEVSQDAKTWLRKHSKFE